MHYMCGKAGLQGDPRLARMQVDDYLPRRWAARARLAPPGAPAATARALSYAFSVSAAVALLNAAPILFLARPASRSWVFWGAQPSSCTQPDACDCAVSRLTAHTLTGKGRRPRWSRPCLTHLSRFLGMRAARVPPAQTCMPHAHPLLAFMCMCVLVARPDARAAQDGDAALGALLSLVQPQGLPRSADAGGGAEGSGGDGGGGGGPHAALQWGGARRLQVRGRVAKRALQAVRRWLPRLGAGALGLVLAV